MKRLNLRSMTLGAAALVTMALAGCSSMLEGDEGGKSGGPSDPSRPGGTGGSGGSTGGSGAPNNPGGGNAGPGLGLPGAPPTTMGTGGSGGFTPAPNGNTNVSLGGAQDFGYYRRLIWRGAACPRSRTSTPRASSPSTTPSCPHPCAASASACKP